MTAARWLAFLVVACLVAACSSDLLLGKVDYPIERTAPKDGIVVAIDAATLKGIYPVKGAYTVGLRTYYAQPGRMMQQVADHELGAMFGHYRRTDEMAVPDAGEQRITVWLEVPDYTFSDGVVTTQVEAKVYGPDRKQLLAKTYNGKGGSSELDFAGVGLEATIEQASLAAYRQAFASLRADLQTILDSRRAVPASGNEGS
jgi:hypothetical protein